MALTTRRRPSRTPNPLSPFPPLPSCSPVVHTPNRHLYQYVHSHRVLHRDLSSGNILLSGSNTLKLSDFGIARSMGTQARGTLLAFHSRVIYTRLPSHRRRLYATTGAARTPRKIPRLIGDAPRRGAACGAGGRRLASGAGIWRRGSRRSIEAREDYLPRMGTSGLHLAQTYG